MHTVADIQAAITLLRLHNPDALRLGELVSLAARIEPELLRAVRLELTPFDAAAEADLWFSALIETRTADWIALVPAAARELRSSLATDRSSLAAAHALVTKAHSSAPATIKLEEEISWLALSAGSDAAEAIESRLRVVLGKLLEDAKAHKGLAHWFAGAAQRLPEEAQATEAYALLYFVTSGLLDGRRINAPQPTLSSIDTLAGSLPASIPKLNIWATLNDYGLTLRSERVPGFVSLEVPRTDPLLFELRPLYGSPRFITLRRGETKTFQVRSSEVDLRTAAGDIYRLRRPRQRSTGSLQNLILGFGGTGAHILTALKELTVLKHGRVPDNIKFLLFDTIADWEPGKRVEIVREIIEEEMPSSEEGITSLDPRTEYFHLADYDPDLQKHIYNYLSRGNPDEFPHLKDWLNAPWFSQHVPMHRLDIVAGAAQQRQIGRYAIFKHAENIVARLRPMIRSLADRAKDSDINIWLIGSSAGGTGAGCLIDAAYLTRLAAEHARLNLQGVIVFPNVYTDVRGISMGRAFSLMRELERVQELGIPPEDRYLNIRRGGLVSSQVSYDRNRRQVAWSSSRLFDDLLYLGSDYYRDDDRRKFFTAVASAIDPYLDVNSAPVLLEKKVNDRFFASGIGAARWYVPTATLTEMFAWEQVAEYLRRAGAPKERDDRVEGLYAGLEMDRQDSASERIRNLLYLFHVLHDFPNPPAPVSTGFFRYELGARHIVNSWYELSGSGRTPDEQTVMLTYVEPCYSLAEAQRPRSSRDWEIKTYKENAAAGGFKETQEESRSRFADSLERVRTRYTNPNGGERTFEKGRRYVFETTSDRLQRKVDDLFIRELELQRLGFAQANNTLEQGTVLTRLFAEVGWILSDSGPLHRVHKIIDHLIGVVANERAERDLLYTRALQDLRESKRTGFLTFGSWVETYQQAARDECSAYIHWFQKYELLKDMQQLVVVLERRFREWEALLTQLLDTLVRRDVSALATVTQTRLRPLQDRLYRAARNGSSLISLDLEPDPQMHGYQEELRTQSANGLAVDVLNISHWEATLNSDRMPTISLVIDSPDLAQQRYSLSEFQRLLKELYQLFYRRIDERLRNTDVFDYLLWLREQRDLPPDAIIKRLDSLAAPLINAGGVPEERILVFKDPVSDRKKDFAASLVLSLHPQGVERGYSDRNSITLIKIKKPGLDQIAEVANCREDYLALRAGAINNNEAHDQGLYRAIVFHPFRQEAEAWHIERYYIKRVNSDVPTLPPRIVRLLEDPEMMQLFVHSIATGAIEKIGDDWFWHGPEGDLILTDYKRDGSVDVIRAAVNFVLKQGEARRDGLRKISREAAKQSALQSAQRNGRTLDEMVVNFSIDKVDYFLADHAPPELRLPLKMVFTFYCDPNTRTSLQFRMDL